MIGNQTIKRQEMRYQSSKVLKTIHNLGITSIISSHLGTLNLLLGTLLHPPKSIQGTHLLPAQDEGLSMAELQGRGNFYHATEFQPKKTPLADFFWGDLPPLPLKGEKIPP